MDPKAAAHLMSAFPRPSFGPNEPADGMSLRDYFAAKAMQGLMGRSWDHIDNDAETIEVWSRSAYAVADAMLKAREA